MELDPHEEFFVTPSRLRNSTHVYHQYTLKIRNGKRDALKEYLHGLGIPSMIYYPLPLNEQDAFKGIARAAEPLRVSRECAESVLSIPMHTELTREIQDVVIAGIGSFFRK